MTGVIDVVGSQSEKGGTIMNRHTQRFCTIVFSILLAGCAPTVEVIKPVGIAGTSVGLPVSSLMFVPVDPFTKECKEALDSEAPPTAIIELSKHLDDFRRAMERSLTASGFVPSREQNTVYVKLQIAQSELRFETLYGSPGGVSASEPSVRTFPPQHGFWAEFWSGSGSMRSGWPGPAFLSYYSGVRSVVFQIEYLDASNRVLGIVRQKWHAPGNLEQTANRVAEFTRETLADRRE
jgi:hypothetical protein